MRIRSACLDKKLIWAIDDEISGLYSIDKRRIEMKCVIDCRQLFPCGIFEVLSNEDYIIMIPREMDKSWILYNKITGRIEYQKVVERKCQGILIKGDKDRNQLYFFPVSIQDPILIVALDTLTCLHMIENWNSGLPDGCGETAWRGTYNGRYVFFSVKNTKILVRMDCESWSVELLELDISENVFNVDYAFGELWVLPERGNQIYQLDENGLVIDVVELSVEDTSDSIPDFARIVVQENYLFFLPFYRKGIYIYDKREKKTLIIPKESSMLEGKNKELYLQYWEYYVMDDQICFLPFGDNTYIIEIHLKSLAYRKKKMSYPAIWSEKEKAWRTSWSYISKRLPSIEEAGKCDLKDFLNYIQYKKGEKDFSQKEPVDKRIWDMLQN